MTDYCEGCRTYTYGETYKNRYCSYARFNQNSECPCAECVIKVMCLDSCEDFDHFKIQHGGRDTD